MYHIFISYRRNDSEDVTTYIFDWLKQKLPDNFIFFDRDVMKPGDLFPDKIMRAVDEAKIILVIIGPQWLSARDEYERRRIDGESDWVRKEIEFALQRRHNKLIVPILIKGAKLPNAEALPPSIETLAEQQSVTVSSISDAKLFDPQMQFLGHQISDSDETLYFDGKLLLDRSGPRDEYLRAMERKYREIILPIAANIRACSSNRQLLLSRCRDHTTKATEYAAP